MKKLNIIIIVIIIAISICIGGKIIYNHLKPKMPNEEEVITLYERAREIYLWFVQSVPDEKIDYKNEFDNTIYPIKDERFSSVQELKEYLSHIFTSSIVKTISDARFKPHWIFDIDGKLYVGEYHGAKSLYSGEEKIKNIEYTKDNKVIITVSEEILSERDYTVVGEKEHNFILVYEDKEWKFSKFYCVGFDL